MLLKHLISGKVAATLALTCLASAPAHAVFGSYWTNFTTVVVYPGTYGGCYASLQTPLSAAGKGFRTGAGFCNDNYVAFNCEGLTNPSTGAALNTKQEGQRKFDAAQLSLITGNAAYVTVDDNIRLNGICYAKAVQTAIPQ